jgi:hypothetical protein
MRLGWPSNTATFTYTLAPAVDTTGLEVLSFRVAQTSSNTNPASGSQDFLIELQGGGFTKAVYVGQFDAIPKPYSRPDLVHNVMTAVRVPLHSFIMNNSQVPLNNIDAIRIRFSVPATGEIYVDASVFALTADHRGVPPPPDITPTPADCREPRHRFARARRRRAIGTSRSRRRIVRGRKRRLLRASRRRSRAHWS